MDDVTQPVSNMLGLFIICPEFLSLVHKNQSLDWKLLVQSVWAGLQVLYQLIQASSEKLIGRILGPGPTWWLNHKVQGPVHEYRYNNLLNALNQIKT